MRKLDYETNQRAFEYAMYMMIGSYFQKATCRTTFFEKRLRLYYLEVPFEKQYRMEDVVIESVEQILLEKIPEEFWREEVEVNIVHEPEEELSMIEFRHKRFVLRVTGNYRGRRKSNLCYRLWTKE